MDSIIFISSYSVESMKLETYTKVAIIFGIAISCILTGIVLSYSVASVFNIYDVVTEIKWAVLDKDETTQQMMNSSSYISFIKRFPDYREEITIEKFEITTTIEAINPNTLNTLRLELHYDIDTKNIREYMKCESMNGNRQMDNSNTIFRDMFIEKTKCLDDDFEFPSVWR